MCCVAPMIKGLTKRTWRTSWALMVGIGAAVVIAGLSSGWFVYSLAQSTLIQEGLQEIRTTANLSAKKLLQESRLHPTRAAVEDLNDMASGHLYLLLVNKSGHFIGSSGSMPAVLPRNGWNSRTPSSGWFRFRNTPYVFASSSIVLNGRTCHLIVVDGLDRTGALLSVLRTALLFGGMLLILSSMLVVVLIIRQLTGPLRALEEAAGTVTLTRPNGQHVAIPSNLTEVVSLTESFNHMLDRLSSAQERERQFISNAAHSLRTPIHIIRGYARTLSQWGHDDPEARHHALKALARESEAMETLVNRLLQLSRVEQENPPCIQRVAVTPYFHAILPNLRDTCLHHPLTLDIASDVPDIGSEPDLLEVVLRTLVENADTYADPDSPVRVFVKPLAETHRVRIGIINQGPEISPDGLAHIFDRFYRARQPASSQHVGLGLAIANSLVVQIQGRWVVESREHQTMFAIDLPIWPV